jgi:hypothetical protein
MSIIAIFFLKIAIASCSFDPFSSYIKNMRGIRPQLPRRPSRPPHREPDAPPSGDHATPPPGAPSSPDAGPPADDSETPDHPQPTEVGSPCAGVRLTLYDVCEILDLSPHRVRALFVTTAPAPDDRRERGDAGEICLCALIDFLRQCPWRCRPTVLMRLHAFVQRALPDDRHLAPIISELSLGYLREYQRRRRRGRPTSARCLLRTSG